MSTNTMNSEIPALPADSHTMAMEFKKTFFVSQQISVYNATYIFIHLFIYFKINYAKRQRMKIEKIFQIIF